MNKEFLQSNISKLTDFYQKEKHDVCLIEGQQGSFKTQLFEESLKFLTEETLVFKFKCFEGSTLDDIFLAFFEDLKKYSQQKAIKIAKIETNSLSQRINHYLTHINNPSVILIDSLENVFNKKNRAEKEEIINFIKHLISMNKFKIVLISRFFDNQIIDVGISENIVMETFTEEAVSKYFQSLKIENPNTDIKKFFEITRGNVNYLVITANLLTSLSISLGSLLKDFETKNISYENFIIQKLLAFVPDNVKKSLYNISLIKEGLTANYLVSMNFFTKEQISYFIEKKVLTNEYGFLFLKNNLKNYLQGYIAHFEKLKIHSIWRDFYNSELPVQPNKRTILISRNTMRAQIEYHNSFLTEEMPKDNEQNDISLMSYLNSNITAWNFKNTNIEPNQNKSADMSGSSQNTKKKFDLEKYELTKNEVNLLSVPFDLNKTDGKKAEEKTYRTFKQQEGGEKPAMQKIADLFEIAQALELSHNPESAIMLYEKAYSMKTDEEYKTYIPQLLEKLAVCSQKLNKISDAIDYYNQLVEYYETSEEAEKMNETRLEIAKIYKNTYKINHARVIYENFINKKSYASNNIIALSYIALAGIEEELSNTDKAIENYKKAFLLSSEIKDGNILAEAYFKYALILDDANQTDAALDYYQKAILNSPSSNRYVSSAYTNIAEIIKEKGNPSKSVEYYKKGLKTDIEQSNYEGIYYICLKLAQTYEDINPAEVLSWLLKALSAAKRTKEKIYIANSYMELGNYYFVEEENEKALKSFILAKQNDSGDISENIEEIELKLLSLKNKMPRNIYEKIIGEYSKNAI